MHESLRNCEQANGGEKGITLTFIHEAGERLGRGITSEEIRMTVRRMRMRRKARTKSKKGRPRALQVAEMHTTPSQNGGISMKFTRSVHILDIVNGQ